MGDIWYGEPKLLRLIGEKLSNLFWMEILQTISFITEDLHFAHPYFFFNYNIFDNRFFSINKTIVMQGIVKNDGDVSPQLPQTCVQGPFRVPCNQLFCVPIFK